MRSAEVCLFKFYSRIFWSAVSDYRSVNAKLQMVGAIVLAAIGFLSHQWADQLSHNWKGLSPWCVLPQLEMEKAFVR